MKILKKLLIVILLLNFSNCLQTSKYDYDSNKYANKIGDWIDLNIGLITYERISPPKASRILAYSSVALYEGLYNGLEGYKTLSGQLNELTLQTEPNLNKNLNWYVVGITSQKTILDYLYRNTSPAALNQINDLYTLQLSKEKEINSDNTIKESIDYGKSIGLQLVDWASKDGYNETRTKEFIYEPKYHQWRPTADISSASLSLNSVLNMVTKYDSTNKINTNNDASLYSDRMLTTNRPQKITNERLAMEPYWSELRPFVIDTLENYSATKPFAYSEDVNSEFYKQALVVYNETKEITDWKIETAHFWADNPGQTGTPPGHWFSIMRQLIKQKDLNLSQTLEMYVLTNISMADAFISCWKDKYDTMVIRPETYIKRVIDKSWKNVVVTPPFPEYTSGHSVCSGAAAEILTIILGNDVSFIDRTHENQYGFEARNYSSFYEAADEAAISRLYGGIHYPMAIYNGLDQGKKIGSDIAKAIKMK